MKDILIDVLCYAGLFLLVLMAVVVFFATIICVSYGLSELLEGRCTWQLFIGIVCAALEFGVFKVLCKYS